MSQQYQSPRGTQDLLDEQLEKFNIIENCIKIIAHKYAFEEIRTPIFEFLNVFTKSVGESSDIVSKEMYVFEDKGGEKLVLRPEGTAAIVRALISNGMSHKLPLKWFYMGPMFRYERPQKGRYRQFHQVGFEYLGTNHYSSDVECINLAVELVKELKIKNYKLLINSIGSNESLSNYKVALLDYLDKYKDKLSADSLVRLDKNPLRILDSKDINDREIIKNAPKLKNYLIKEDQEFYTKVKESLTYLNIDFVEDDNLVRGLDYYTHTVFEIVSDDLGSQSAILAGGRYNNLIKQMGGPDVGAFGFAGGIERLALLIENKPSNNIKIAIATLDENSNNYAFKVANILRNSLDKTYSINFILGKDISQKLKKANSLKYNYAIVIGSHELELNKVNLKNLQTGLQNEVLLTDLVKFILESK
jgi:histidyl-tRNA synthetase